jgi:hypothetical protein
MPHSLLLVIQLQTLLRLLSQRRHQLKAMLSLRSHRAVCLAAVDAAAADAAAAAGVQATAVALARATSSVALPELLAVFAMNLARGRRAAAGQVQSVNPPWNLN